MEVIELRPKVAGMIPEDRAKAQLAEALSPLNRWYCSQYFGYNVTSIEVLLTYYIKSGGAQNFRQRELAEQNSPGRAVAG